MLRLVAAQTIAVALVGCAASGKLVATAPGGQALLSESAWVEGSRWLLMPLNPESGVRVTLRLEVTDESADTCIAGEWRALKVLGGSHGSVQAPAYTREGSRVTVLLNTSKCDAYHLYDGIVVDDTFSGLERITGLGSSEERGHVVGGLYFNGNK